MFQDMLVKIRKMTARSTPAGPGMTAEMPKMTMGKKPSIGIDCRTSSRGMMTVSALWLRAAVMPTARLKRMLKNQRNYHPAPGVE